MVTYGTTTIPREVHTTRGIYEEADGKRTYKSGGGMVVDIQQRLSAERQAYEAQKAVEEQKKKQAAIDIEARTRQSTAQATREFRESVRDIKSLSDRQAKTLQLQQELANIKAQYTLERIQAGIITAGTIKTTTGDVTVTPETAGQIERSLKGQRYPSEVYERMEEKRKERLAEAIKRGDTVEFTPTGARIISKPTVLGKIGEKYAKAEEYIRKEVTYKAPPATSVFGTERERMRYLKEYQELWEKQTGQELKPGWKKAQEFYSGIFPGYYGGLREKPLKTAALTATFFVASKVLSLVGAGITKVAGPVATKVVGKVAGPTLLGLYSYGTYQRIKEEPTWIRRGEKFGEIGATEVTPMITGGYLGAKVWPKVEGWWATRGRKEIPTERLVPKEVITGKERLVKAPSGRISAKEYLRLFKEGRYRLPDYKEPMMYHATGAKFWKGGGFEVTPGASEFPGLYGAYGISPHFLRTGGASYSLYGGDLFSPYGKPGVATVIPKKFIIGKKAPLGYAFIPAIKPEVEAIIPPTTKVILVGKSQFFRWDNIRVPIDVFKTTTGVTTGLTAIPVSQVSASYYFPSSYPITTPSSMLVGIGVSYYKPSEISRVSYPSYISPSKISTTSYVRPSEVSRISYIRPSKPSSVISPSKVSRPSYITPSKPSSITPSKPSYTSGSYYRPPPPSKKSYSSILKKAGIGKKILQAFEVQVRRRGKFQTIAKGLPKGKALKLGAEKTRRTLAATFRLVPKGVTIQPDILYKPSPLIFRAPKKKAEFPLTFIQLRGKRLSMKSEVSEIIKSKKKMFFK